MTAVPKAPIDVNSVLSLSLPAVANCISIAPFGREQVRADFLELSQLLGGSSCELLTVGMRCR